MTINLKNGLKLASVVIKIDDSNSMGRPPKLDGGRIGLTSAGLQNSNNGFEFKATVTTSNFTPQQMKENTVRCIQLCQFNNLDKTWAGRKDSDGMVDFSLVPPVQMKWLIDATTGMTNTDRGGEALDYPYCSLADKTTTEGAMYIAETSDSPYDFIGVDHTNKKTKRRNYVWAYGSDILFLTYAVFVHKTGEREPLMGCQWLLHRSGLWKHREGKPKLQQYHNYYDILDKNVKLKDTDPLYKLLVNPGSTPVANTLINNVLWFEGDVAGGKLDVLENWWGNFDKDFWID
jgi:hypothetical protein